MGATFATSSSQDILMTIGDKEITLDEFERIYKKNNNSITTNQQTPEEYLDLFINFKLKVMEAENLGMDTTKKFLNEFNSYKDQLAEPYLTDEETREALMKEAYERMKKDVHVSHILLGLGNQPTPEDTLERYERAMEIRQRILDGEDFETVARATSEDPGARINGGDLGYFTVFMMVYPFETAAYELETGEVSMPVRTQHGYHILKKHGERPAIGQVKVAHIFLRTPQEMSAEEQEKVKDKAMAISDSIKAGVPFGEMAGKYSDDRNSAANGGELPWFGTGRMIREFEQEAFALENPGDVTEPFLSSYGWHIIQLQDKKEIGSYEEMESTLQSRALKGDRDRVKRERYLGKLKDKYDFSLNKGTYERLYTIVDSTIFDGSWSPGEVSGAGEVLFSITGETTTLGDFIDYVDGIKRRRSRMPVENYVDITFDKYLEDYLVAKEKESLPERFPEYRYILQEYHDGILLFDLMDQKVWTKAVEDTTGLEAFFKKHRDDYMWGERMKGVIVSADSTADLGKLLKRSSRIASGRWDQEKLNKKFCENDTVPCVTLEEFLVEEGRNAHVDALNGKTGTGNVYREDGRDHFVILKKIVSPTRKALHETRGQVTSDYQDYLEKEWIKTLRDKYEIDVNRALLSQIE
jgi:peptidyl-prolyl cis-trans isomerase SurA